MYFWNYDDLMSFISVVIPSYNRSESALRAVNSVLRQTYTNLEVILVDDGSTDGTSADVSGLNDPRVVLLKQENQGVSSARNLGINYARGEFIALLDSDDVWKEDKLQKQIGFMLKGGWEIAQTSETWIRRGKRVNPKIRHAKRAGWIFAPSLELCLVSPSCVMFSRSCWEKVGPFDPELPACEDYDLWLRCSLFYPVGHVPGELVYKYGGHPDQLSRKIIGLDLYRIYSLCKLLADFDLSRERYSMVFNELNAKLKVYMQGCVKRGKQEEAQRIREYVLSRLNPEYLNL